jgi:hypothetical protein
MSDGTEATETRVARAVTGMVAGGYAVDYDLADGAVPCEQCGDALGAGDAVTVALACYEGHTWEPYGFYCLDHRIERVTAVLGDSADEQAVVAATLEPTGYRDPRGELHPDAVSLGGVEVLDYSAGDYG